MLKLAAYSMPMAADGMPAWELVLRNAGYPTDVVVIDFETFFDDDFHMYNKGNSGVSTIEYVTDKRFEILSCAFTMMNSESLPSDYVNTFCQVGEDMVRTQIGALQKRYGDNLERCTLVIQNAHFDAMVLLHRYGIAAPYIVDLLGLARHWQSRIKNDLDSQADREDLEEKGDTSQFRAMTFRTRYKKAKGRKKGPKMPVQLKRSVPGDDLTQKLAEYNVNDNLREWELFTIHLPRLSNPTVELQLMQHTIDLMLKPTIKVDFAKGAEIITAMEQMIADHLKAVQIADRGLDPYTDDEATQRRAATHEEISGNTAFEGLLVRALQVAGDNPQRYYKPAKKGYILALAKTDPEVKILQAHPDARVRALINARVAIRSWPTHISRVQRIMAQAAANGGYLPVPLKYHGAHTGRWSGGEKINLQNLGSRGHELITAIRHMLIAPEGHVLAIADASQIEARVLAWIAGQWDLCKQFANGEEIYCGFATKVLGWKVRKPLKKGTPGFIAPIEKRHSWARNAVGKVGVLGCGYGMGTDKIFDYAQGEVTLEQAEKIKKTYRDENREIVRFWHDIEKAFLYTAKYKRPCTLPRGLTFHSTPDCDVIITLPNGRELKYHKVRVEPGDRGDTLALWNAIEHKWEHIWGGHLTENVVQAMSRDILAEAFLRLEARGYHTGLHVHDEVVAVVRVEQGAAAVAAQVEELSRRPAWALECPLGAEGQLSPRYVK